MNPLLTVLAGAPEIENLLSDAAQIEALLKVERALAAASADAGWIGMAASEAIAAAIDAFAPDHDDLARGMMRDGVLIPALVSQLRARLAEPHRAALHRGATSQDIIDTALMVQLVPIFDLLETGLAALLVQLDHLAAENGARALMAHTRMQVALPTNWGAKLGSWSAPLRRHLQALVAMRKRLLVVQLGGPVGDRGSFEGFGDRIAAGMARELGLGLAEPWQATRDPLVGFGALLALISGSLGKIGMDIALLAQNEIAALRLEGGGGSSAMAHKSNPVNAEVLVALARYNAGLSGILQQAMVHEYERSGAAWTLEWLTLPPILINTGAGLRLGHALFGQLRLA